MHFRLVNFPYSSLSKTAIFGNERSAVLLSYLPFGEYGLPHLLLSSFTLESLV